MGRTEPLNSPTVGFGLSQHASQLALAYGTSRFSSHSWLLYFFFLTQLFGSCPQLSLGTSRAGKQLAHLTPLGTQNISVWVNTILKKNLLPSIQNLCQKAFLLSWCCMQNAKLGKKSNFASYSSDYELHCFCINFCHFLLSFKIKWKTQELFTIIYFFIMFYI